MDSQISLTKPKLSKEYWVKLDGVFVGTVFPVAANDRACEDSGKWAFECHTTGRFDDYYTSLDDAITGLVKHLES